MATSIQDVEAAALDLPAEDRAELAQRLLSSLDRDPEVEAAWDEEIRRRIADLEYPSSSPRAMTCGPEL